MAIKRIIGFVIMFVLMALAMETPLAFVNIPSVLIVFGLIIGGAMASGHCLTNLISISWNKNATESELWDAADTYRRCSKLAIGAGAVATLIGAILMLGSLTDPAAIGPSMAIAILTVLYAVILKYFIFEPMSVGLEKRAMALPCEDCEDKSDEEEVVAPDNADFFGQDVAK